MSKVINEFNSNNSNEQNLTFWEHLDELRQRLMRIFIALMLGWIVGWFLQPTVYQILSESSQALIPKDIDFRETFHSITEPFMLKLKVAFYIGLIIVLPWIMIQAWGFLSPGLKWNEKKPLKIFLPVSIILFGLGSFCCWQVLPQAFGWFVSYVYEFPNTSVYQEPGTLIFFIFKMLLAFGVGFQLPILIFIAAKMGIVNSKDLVRYWRHAILGIFGISMVFVPTADPISLVMLSLPLSLLYFLSIAIVKFTTKKPPWPEELNQLD